MQRRYLISNWLFFIVFSFLLALSINSQLKDEFIFFNENIAMLLFCLSIPLKLYRIRVGQYLIFVALLILLFSPLSYYFTITDGDTSVTHNGAKSTSLISPITFLILILFLAFNYSAMIDLYQLLTKGSDKEQKEALAKEIEFYYNKFNACSDSEMVDIVKMYNDYPAGAKLALNRIRKDKGID